MIFSQGSNRLALCGHYLSFFCFLNHPTVECLSYHGVKSRTLDYECSREGFCEVKSRTLGLFTPCHSISKPIVILRGKKSQGKVSRGKESQGKVSRGKKSLHQL